MSRLLPTYPGLDLALRDPMGRHSGLGQETPDDLDRNYYSLMFTLRRDGITARALREAAADLPPGDPRRVLMILCLTWGLDPGEDERAWLVTLGAAAETGKEATDDALAALHALRLSARQDALQAVFGSWAGTVDLADRDDRDRLRVLLCLLHDLPAEGHDAVQEVAFAQEVDFETGAAAWGLLGRSASPRATAVVMTALANRDGRCLEGVRNLRSPAAIADLQRVAEDGEGDWGFRAAAVTGLISIGTGESRRVVRDLFDRLNSIPDDQPPGPLGSVVCEGLAQAGHAAILGDVLTFWEAAVRSDLNESVEAAFRRSIRGPWWTLTESERQALLASLRRALDTLGPESLHLAEVVLRICNNASAGEADLVREACTKLPGGGSDCYAEWHRRVFGR